MERMPHKEWNKLLDSYLRTGRLDPDNIPKLDAFQQGVINEIKKAFKRIKNG